MNNETYKIEVSRVRQK